MRTVPPGFVIRWISRITANGSGRCSRQCAASTRSNSSSAKGYGNDAQVVDHVGAVGRGEVDVDVAVLRERAGAEVELLHAAIAVAGRARRRSCARRAKPSSQSWNMSSVQSCLRWSRVPARCSCTRRSTSRGVEQALADEPRRREQVEHRLAQAGLQPLGDRDAEALLLAARRCPAAAARRRRASAAPSPVRPRSFRCGGTRARNSTSVWSRNGARTSSEASMLARSVFTRMSSARYVLA